MLEEKRNISGRLKMRGIKERKSNWLVRVSSATLNVTFDSPYSSRQASTNEQSYRFIRRREVSGKMIREEMEGRGFGKSLPL